MAKTVRKSKKKETKMHASNEERYMPDTNKQGWGSITKQKTQVSETENNGVRVITRTPL